MYISTHLFTYCVVKMHPLIFTCLGRPEQLLMPSPWLGRLREPQEQDVVGLSHLPLTSVLVRAGIEADPTWISCYLGGKSEHCGAAAKCQGH